MRVNPGDNFNMEHIARSVMVAGLYPNVAHSASVRESKGKSGSGKQSFRTRLGFMAEGSRVTVHPTSVISEKSLNPQGAYFLLYHEKIQTTQVFIRGCTMLPHLAVALFGGFLEGAEEEVPAALGVSKSWCIMRVDKFLKFAIDRSEGNLLLKFREVLDEVMSRWVSGLERRDVERAVVRCALQLLHATCQDALKEGG